MSLSSPRRRLFALLNLALVSLIGITGAIGRNRDWQGMAAWLPRGAVQMKETTGVLFFCVALLGLLLCLRDRWKASISWLIAGACAGLLFVLLGLTNYLFHFEPVVWDPRLAAGSLFPSVVTLVGMGLAALVIVGISFAFRRSVLLILSLVVALIGFSTIFGYLAEGLGAGIWSTRFYFFIPSMRVTAMALNTGVTFVLLGWALYFLCDTVPHSAAQVRDLRERILNWSCTELAEFLAILWGAWALIGNSFGSVPSMRLANAALGGNIPGWELLPETIFAFLLVLAAIGIHLGRHKESLALSAGGALLAFSVFFCAFGASVATLPGDPASGAYLSLAILFGWCSLKSVAELARAPRGHSSYQDL